MITSHPLLNHREEPRRVLEVSSESCSEAKFSRLQLMSSRYARQTLHLLYQVYILLIDSESSDDKLLSMQTHTTSQTTWTSLAPTRRL
jgi:hypothetical protein